MSTIWITSELETPGEYSYGANICNDTLKVWLHLQSYGQNRYRLTWSAEKRGGVRGRLGTRQKEQAKALKAELEPLFLAAVRAAGWQESIDPIFHHPRWTRA